jgi:hypothetical protein
VNAGAAPRWALVVACLSGPIAAPLAAAARREPERTLKVRILDVDAGRDLFRADVAGRPTLFRVAAGGLLRGFHDGDLVILRVRDGVVFDLRMAIVSGQVIRTDDRRASIRVSGREMRFGLARSGLRQRLRAGDFVRFEVEERRDGTRVITRVY